MGPTNHNQVDTEQQKRMAEIKPLTRQQRRYKERVEQEAQALLSKFAAKYYEIFMDEEPESLELERKKKELSAKWKMHCAKNRLIPEAYGLFDDAAKAIHEKYKTEIDKA